MHVDRRWAIQPLLVSTPDRPVHLTLILYDNDNNNNRPTQWFFDPASSSSADGGGSLVNWMCNSQNACLLDGYFCKAVLHDQSLTLMDVLGGGSGQWTSASACLLFATVLWHLAEQNGEELRLGRILSSLIEWLSHGSTSKQKERIKRLTAWSLGTMGNR